MRAGGAEGDPERDGRRTFVNGWESRLWRLEDKHLREGSSVRQFGRPRPLRIRIEEEEEEEEIFPLGIEHNINVYPFFSEKQKTPHFPAGSDPL